MQIVCRRKKTFEPLIRAKLSQHHISTPAIQYGTRHESTAVSNYVQHKQEEISLKFVVEDSGLIINVAKPWLAASPDGTVDDPTAGCGLLEVKCPYKCRNKSFAEAVKDSTFFLTHKDEMFKLKVSHQYYYQVQFQLYVSEFEWCDFVVWSPKELYIEGFAAMLTFSIHQSSINFTHSTLTIYCQRYSQSRSAL